MTSSASALLRDLPSNSRCCSQLKQPMERAKAPVTYYATHEHTQPPPDQVVATEKTNILLRQFHQLAEAKRERQKRPPAQKRHSTASCRSAKALRSASTTAQPLPDACEDDDS
eukprot:CAMPEP_0119375834 /NCGR_PEP_ID=MMETSP1334-20130426/36735_1 /TAXON_ID=127549 /ORGANISM="Calcidiscus leptoporus, Strain RCC1130" /LENGTH=112 /DNA_ID=CAMNT_0007394231 /DNA_START=20 /DNA_END=358 /DNA_ORIENTATION=+